MICVLPFGGSKRKPFAYIFDAFKLCEISTTADMTKYHGDWQDNMYNYSTSSYFSSLVKRKSQYIGVAMSGHLPMITYRPPTKGNKITLKDFNDFILIKSL